MISRVLELWFHLDRRVRFILVGGYNTLFSYLIFLLLEGLLSNSINYLVVLCVAHFISVFNSFINFRVFVFQSRGRFWHEYIKVNIVYIGYLLLNVILLYFLKSILGVNLFVAQIICIVILTLLFYQIHKNFSFKYENKIS